VILSRKVNIWREIVNSGAGFAGDDTVGGTEASLRLWSALDSAEISAVRAASKKCFDEFFNFTVTSRKLLDIIERVAQSNPRFRSTSSKTANQNDHGVQPI
jgi:hypothetical protein